MEEFYGSNRLLGRLSQRRPVSAQQCKPVDANPKVHRGLRVMRTCRCGLTSCHTCNNGGVLILGQAVGGRGYMGSQYFCSKSALKNKDHSKQNPLKSNLLENRVRI